MYYIMHKQDNFIRLTIHLSTHDHPMAEGCSKEALYQVKSLFEEEVFHILRATVSAITLATSKIFLSEHLLNEDGEGLMEVFKSDKLHLVMHKFITLFSPNVFQALARNKGYVSSILALKVNSGYYFIQDSCFLWPKIGIVFFCSRCLHGNGNGYDLVKRM
jgi:hypothetical protein